MTDSKAVFLPTLAPTGADEPALGRVLADFEGTVLALVAEADREAVPELQEGCRQLGLGLAGAVFPALLQGGRFRERGAWLLGLSNAPSVLVSGLSAEPADAARAIAGAIEPLLGPEPPLLFLLFDGTVPNIGSILDALYRELADSVRYLGACAGSGSFQPMPCVFDAERVAGGAVMAVLLPPDTQSALCHGYGAPDDELTATATTGNRIRSINWEPAFEAYRERLRESLGVTLDRENFYEHGVHFPFGLLLGNGRAVVRIPTGLLEDGSILFAGEVPNDALMTLLTAPAPDSPATIERVATAIGRQRGDTPMLAFYCAGRRQHLGAAAEREVEALATATGATLVGAVSLGEIGCLEDMSYPYFHNGAVFCAAFGV